jgi:hypothetical protein
MESVQEKETVQGELGDWLEGEEKALQQEGDFEKLPSPPFEAGKIVMLRVDASQEFQRWQDPESGKIKAIIPCLCNVKGVATRCRWWLNRKNPIYKDVIRLCRTAGDKTQVMVRVMQVGQGLKTKYQLVTE